ncbi:hemagglutinin repeat-containing protein [Rhizobium sp. 768_B6_N1_8]|uniref:hemagglutinin repeat-containing protein n=1 Tax=unclassified Rhizobium TaxID=2613769 RepID=UPI003F241239
MGNRLGKSTVTTHHVAGADRRSVRRFAHFARQSLALLLSSLLMLQPMLANAQSVSASSTAAGANQPGVGTAPNGVPLIDIVTPNSQGLSHNKYDNFNVGMPGLILNNFKGEIGNSNLGGVTPGNPNLNTSGPATVILNEVTSGNRSALNGPTEVFGGRADVIIANPNGITCDGCGFINTPHATLTTGVPNVGGDGTLKGFTVNGGDVTIGPNGGNFAARPGAVDLFDIVSRAVTVNGPVYGKDLRVTAGRNQFDYATGNATPLAATSGTPEYAIDGSALGAMQAGRIKMVVTERGAGVRMRGDMAANAGELSLSADGKISLGNVSGQQGVSISSKAKVTAAKITSKAKVAVQADQGIAVDTVAADDDILLSSGSGLLSVGGEVNGAANVLMSSAAGIAAGGAVAGNALTLAASSGDIAVAGAGKSIGTLTLIATSGAISAASLVSSDDIALTAGADIGISSDILAQGNVTASGRSISAGSVVSGLDAAATNAATNGSTILGSAGDIRLVAGGGAIDIAGLLSAGDTSVTAAALTADSVTAHGAIIIDAAADVSGQILSAGHVSISGSAISAEAIVSGLDFAATAASPGGAAVVGPSGDLTLDAGVNGSVDVDTLIAAGAFLVDARRFQANNISGHGKVSINADTSIGGQLLAAGDVLITGPAIRAGGIASGVDFAATAQSANGSLVLQQAGSTSLVATSGSIIIDSALMSSGNLSADASQNIAYSKLQSLSSADLAASGQISYGNPTSTVGNLTLTTTNIDLSNGGAGNIAAGGTLTLNADSANLSNNSITLGGLALNLTGAADLSGTRINAVTNAGGSGDITVKASGLSTSYSTALLATNDLALTLPALTNAGQLVAGNDLTLNVAGDVTNSTTGLAYAGNDAGLFVGGVLTNDQGAIIAGHDLEIAGAASGQRNTGVTNISGLMQAGNDTSILTANLTNRRAATPQWTTGTLVSSGVVSGFTLNSVAAGLPFGYLETRDQNMYQLYAGVDPALWQDYEPLLWSKATLADGTVYHAWTWISGNGPTKVQPIFDWIMDRVPKDANGNPVVDPNNPSRYFIIDEVNSGGSDTSTTYTWDWSSHLSQSVYEDRLVGSLSPEATIWSSRNLTIDATNLTNSFSSIEAGGNASLRGSTLTNTGVTLFRTTTTTCSAQGACTAYDANGNANPSKNIANGSSIVSSVQAIGGVSANIKAGGALSVNFGSVSNTSAAGSMAGGASVAAAGTPGNPLSALSGLTAGGALFNVNAGLGGGNPLTGLGNIAERIRVDGAALEAAAKPQSGGVGGNIPHQIFLFETRGDFLDVSKFYGSGYFMDRIGYMPETTVPFLGDAYFENQLIDTQLRQLVGEGLGRSTFLAGSDAIEQMKTLLEKGADYAKDHGLAVGQGLTPEQAAALTESIVLYQWQTVNGVQVLAPVVYVAAADRQKMTGAGAAMAGGSVDMNVGNLENTGLIASAGGLAVSGSSIQGSGTFLSRGDTALNATNGITLAAQTMTIGGQNVVNTNAGVMAGGALQLAGGSGDLGLKGVKVNAGGSAQLSGTNVVLGSVKADNSGQQNATATQVNASGNLAITAANNVDVIGSSAKAGGDLSVKATNGAVNVVSTDVVRKTDDGYTKVTGTDQQGSQLSAGGNMLMNGNQGILLSGSQLSATADVGLTSDGGDINISTSQSQTDATFGKGRSSSVSHTGSEIKAGGDIVAKSGNDLNIIGSGLTAGGAVGLQATGDVTVAEATDSATRDTRGSTKSGGFLGSRETTSSHLETTTAVGSAINGKDGVAIASGGDTIVSASKVTAGDEDHEADLAIQAGGNLIVTSGKDTETAHDTAKRSGFLSKGSSTYDAYNEETVGSQLNASGDVNLDAGKAVIIAGSKIGADGSINVAADSVSIVGGQETHEAERQSKKSGIGVGSGGGFLSIYGNHEKNGAQSSTFNVGSALSAGEDVTLTARKTDLNIMGSSVEAENDINLSAARDVNVTPGGESFSESKEDKKSGFGLSFSAGNGGFSVGIGAQTTKDSSAQQSDTNGVAMLTAGHDLNISAGNNVNLQAVQASAERDVNLIAGNDINLLSAQDRTNYEEVHEKTFAGVTLSVTSQLGSAAQSIMNSAERLSDSGGVNALTNTAIAGLGFYQAYKDLQGVYDGLTSKDPKIGTGLSFGIGISAGISHQESSSVSSSATPVVTSIRAGSSISLEAENGSITSDGAQIAAGYDKYGLPDLSGDPVAGDIFLSAKNGDINLNSAIGTSDSTDSNSSWSAGIGVKFGCTTKNGCGGSSFGVSGSYGKGGSDTTAVTHTNTHLNGTGNVNIVTNDLTLKGATVAGNSVTVDARSLTIESQVDTAKANADQLNLSGQIGFGASGLSGATQKASGNAAVVSEQSGIHAGTGGLDIDVSGQTSLVGGLITSEANADRNSLSSGTLTVTDVDTHSKWKAETYGGSIGAGGLSIAPPIQVGESETGKAYSAIGANIGITITDPEHQSQDIGTIRRDTENTNTSLPGLPDLQNILRDQYKTQADLQAAQKTMATLVGDIASELYKQATTEAERDFWSEGGQGRALLHAIGGGILGGVNGWEGALKSALGGAATTLMAPAIRELVKGMLKGTKYEGTPEGDALAKLIGATLAAGVGGAVGGGEGAAYGAANYQFNYLYHDEKAAKLKAESSLAACKAKPESCTQAEKTNLQAEINRYEALDELSDAYVEYACTYGGRLMCLSALQDTYKAALSYEAGHAGYADQDAYNAYLLQQGIDPNQMAAEAWEIYALRQSLSDTIGQRDAQDLQITLNGLGLGAGIGVGATAIYLSPSAFSAAIACARSSVCFYEMGVMLADAAAGEAIGGASFGVSLAVASGQLVLRKGDQIIGVIDQATGRPIQLTEDGLQALRAKLPPVGGELTGTRTAIPPRSDAATRRSLIRENESAELLAQNGFKVEQNPVIAGPKEPDYRINGEIFDNYAPSTSNARNIASEIARKITNGQTERVVVNLADSSVSPAALEAQLTAYAIPGLKQAIIIDRSGGFKIIKFGE